VLLHGARLNAAFKAAAMDSLWPWVAVAALGALHGVNPAGGWPVAAVHGARAGSVAGALRALWPIAAGHLISVALVAGTPALGLGLPRTLLQWLAGALLLVLLVVHWRRRVRTGSHVPVPGAGVALWSFIVSTSHGAGLMLVPALVPLCLGDAPAREITAGGSLAMGLAVVGVHMAVMLVATAVAAALACLVLGRAHALRRYRHHCRAFIAPPISRS
jgi:hypothetical protein